MFKLKSIFYLNSLFLNSLLFRPSVWFLKIKTSLGTIWFLFLIFENYNHKHSFHPKKSCFVTYKCFKKPCQMFLKKIISKSLFLFWNLANSSTLSFKEMPNHCKKLKKIDLFSKRKIKLKWSQVDFF